LVHRLSRCFKNSMNGQILHKGYSNIRLLVPMAKNK